MVDRYDFYIEGDTYGASLEQEKCKDGDWVSYIDYVSREQELLEQINRLNSQHEKDLLAAYRDGRDEGRDYPDGE